MLTRFFEKCASDPIASGLLYHEMPKHFTWNRAVKDWQTRKQRGDKAIGRMISVHPRDAERYYLRMLLCSVKGPTSFEDLKTVGLRRCVTYKEAAAARGLLEDDTEWNRCLQEAISFQMPRQLRQLFAVILMCCNPVDPRKLWEDCVGALSEDYQRQYHVTLDDRRVMFHILKDLNQQLVSNGGNLSDFSSLPQ